jgi:hypothetical protein
MVHLNDKFKKQDTLRLHHHVMIGVHQDTLLNFQQFIGQNVIDTDLRFTTPILTTNLVSCDPSTVSAHIKTFTQVPKLPVIPDKYHRVRNPQSKFPLKSKRIH